MSLLPWCATAIGNYDFGDLNEGIDPEDMLALTEVIAIVVSAPILTLVPNAVYTESRNLTLFFIHFLTYYYLRPCNLDA